MYTVSEVDKKRITELLERLQHWFNLWFRGEIEKESLEEQMDIFHDDWRLVNKQTPAVINSKDDFRNAWPMFHGRYKDKIFAQKRDIVSIDKLSNEFFMVLSHEITELEEEIKRRPLTEILKRELETGEFKIFHVHE